MERTRRSRTVRVLVGMVLLATSLVAGAPATGAASGAPRATPAFTVSPSTGLVDNQTVTVTGSAAADNGVTLCPTASTSYDDCVYLTELSDPATYNVPARYIWTTADGAATVTDCRTTSCSLRVWSWAGSGDTPTLVGDVALGFDPTAPLRTAPTLSVSPSTDVADGQDVDVTITEVGGTSLPVFECTRAIDLPADIAAIFDVCDLERADFLDASPSGTTHGTFTVTPFVQTTHGPVDCRATGAACVLVTLDDVYQVADTPISFDPAAPVLPAIIQRFDPADTGPSDFATTYDLVGFTPHDPFTVSWCNDTGTCLSGTVASGTLDGSGMGTFTYSEEVIPAIPEGDTTCNDGCTLTAMDAHGLRASGGVSVVIDTGNPVGPDETFTSDRLPVTVTPRKNLHDGQQVTVTGSGFAPGAEVSVIQCTGSALDDGLAGCDLDTSTALQGRLIHADALGQVRTTVDVKRFINVDASDTDCADGNIDPDAWAAGIAEDPTRETTMIGEGYFTCIIGVGDMADYRHSGGSPIAFEGAVFKPLPWEHDGASTPPDTSTTAPAAQPVSAQPAFTG